MQKNGYLPWKRFFDIALSLPALIVSLPLLLVIAVWVKLDSPGPVFFTQKRVGLNKKHFIIYKFRTMRADAPKNVPTHMMHDTALLITRAGRFLRRTSLDELPQLINILKGDMSLVGPRPALYNQYDLIAERDKYDAHRVRPGLTGLAQIRGRDELEIPVKARLDGWYVANLSLRNDMSIIYHTIGSVLRHEGVRDN